MKFLLNHLHKHKGLFMPGGKLAWLYPLYEAQESFLFTPPDTTQSAPHVRDGVDLKRVMITVIIALIPVVLFTFYNTGRQFNIINQIPDATALDHWTQGLAIVMPVILVSYIVGGLIEVLFAIIRKHEINEGFLVTGLLFPISLPPTIPLWQVALGVAFGVIIGKEIFGGTGFNVLNPALVGRGFLFFSFPTRFSGDVYNVVLDIDNVIDGYTGATPLTLAASVPQGESVIEALTEAGFTWSTMFLGLMGGSMAETSALASLVGGVILLVTGVGAWRIMAGGVIGLTVAVTSMNLLPADSFIPFTQLPIYYHLVMGTFVWSIIFMATDPVSSAATLRGKWIYGILIGVMVAVIRVANPAFTGGVLLSILFGNVMAPMIDHFVLKAHIRKRQVYIQSRNSRYAKS